MILAQYLTDTQAGILQSGRRYNRCVRKQRLLFARSCRIRQEDIRGEFLVVFSAVARRTQVWRREIDAAELDSDQKYLNLQALAVAAMTHQMARHFFPVTTGLVRNYTPRIYEFIFPAWAAERCPMPYANLLTPGGDAVTVFWPLTALVILSGLVTCWLLGARLLIRALREGARARQGLFIWSSAFLSYGFMCLGGFFFHCFHIRPVFHMMDVAATGLASLSIIAGFAAFSGMVDDRTTTQRVTWVLSALAFVIVDLYSPSLVQEQLYALPCVYAVSVGGLFLQKSLATTQKGAQQAGQREVQRWLLLGGVSVVVGVTALPLDKYLCVYLGAEFSFLFWLFFGCNIAMFAVDQFVLMVADKNLQFPQVKSQ